MPLEINLQNYQSLPNLKRLKEAEYSEFSYYSLGFEISFKDENNNFEQEHNNFICALILLVDCYEKKLSILFDKCDYVMQHNTHIQNNISNNKLEFKNTDGLDDYVNLKAVLTQTKLYDYKNLELALQAYINNDIKTNINTIADYLEKNDINYHPQEFNNFINTVKNKINEAFSEEYLKNFIAHQVNNTNSLLMHQDLNKKIPIKHSQPNQKLKI